MCESVWERTKESESMRCSAKNKKKSQDKTKKHIKIVNPQRILVLYEKLTTDNVVDRAFWTLTFELLIISNNQILNIEHFIKFLD